MENFKVLTHVRFGKVRTVELENAPYFVGRDIGSILGYARPEGFVAKHVQKDDCRKLPVRALDSANTSLTTLINRHGVEDLLAASSSPSVTEIRDWLLGDKDVSEPVIAVPPVIVVKGVRAYIDAQNIAWLDAEFIARGLGFVETKDGVEYVMWRRVNAYLEEFGFRQKLSNGSFIPENMFYRLVWKARTEAALEFQSKVADEILPSIRQNGYYAAPNGEDRVTDLNKEVIRLRKQIEQVNCTDLAVVYCLLMSNGAVKIGITKDLPDRIKQLKAETKLDVFNFASTRYMPREEALALEAALKEKYAADCLGGEFFDVRFLDVAAQL